jgi:cytolethal distending toxin subunit A
MVHLVRGCKRVFLAVLVTVAFWGSASTPAWADDEVDVAVDAFAIAGSSVGFTLDQTEKTIVKAIVRCAGTNKQLLICAREEVIRRLPADAQPIVTCMLQGKRIDACAEQAMVQRFPPEVRGITQCIARGQPLSQCGSAEAVRRLPPEIQAIASCIASGRTFEACAGEEAARRLPAETRDLTTCVVERSDFGRCTERAAANTTHKQALAVIEKLKADGRNDLGAGPPTPIGNIIGVAEGIREDDWLKVSRYGGPEVYKAAAKIVLNVLLTPVFQPLIGPIVDTIVQNRVDLVTRLVKALKKKDEKAVGEIAVEGYLILHVEVACALPMPDDMREALCGTVGKIIKDVAHVGGDAADLAKRLIAQPLNIPDALWTETQSVRERLEGKKTGCTPAPNYYASNYVQCYHRATYLKMSEPTRLGGLSESLNNVCRRYYDRCYFSNRFDGLCNPQRDMFLSHVDQLAAGVDEAAALYARSLHDSLATAGSQACIHAIATKRVQDFTTNCADALQQQVPMTGGVSDDSCHAGQPSTTQSAHWLACKKAIDARNPQRVAADVCRESQKSWERTLRSAARLPDSAPANDAPGTGTSSPRLSAADLLARRELKVEVDGTQVWLVNAKTGKCLTIAGGVSTENNVGAVQFMCDGDLSRRWTLTKIGVGGVYQVRNVKTGKCLTIAGGVSTDNNVGALQYNCDNHPSRTWKISDATGGLYRIINVQTAKCLTIAGGVSTDNNVGALQYNCDANLSRRWKMTPPHSRRLGRMPTTK